MEVKRRIEYTPEIRRKIEEVIGCSPAMISQSLSFRKTTSLSNAIRNEAIRIGAKEIVTAEADKVLFIDKHKLEWQKGCDKIIVDLDNYAIQAHIGGIDHQVKKAGFRDLVMMLDKIKNN